MKQVGALRDVLERDVRYVEIEFEGVDNLKPFNKYGRIRTENRVNYLRIENEKTRDKVINEIIKKNGKIISVVPVRKTLEEHFMQAMDE